MSGITSLFSNPQQDAANQATQAANQQDQYAQQMYQEALANQAQQEGALRGEIANIGAMGNPFAQAAGQMHPQFLSPNADAATFQGGNVPSAQAPPTPPTPPQSGGGSSAGGGGTGPIPIPPRPSPRQPMPMAYNVPGNVFAGGRA